MPVHCASCGESHLSTHPCRRTGGMLTQPPSASGEKAKEWEPLKDLERQWREYGNSPVPKNTGGMPKEEYHAARMQALVCADQLAALVPLLARKIAEERLEENKLACGMACSCDMMRGYTCSLHLRRADLEKKVQP